MVRPADAPREAPIRRPARDRAARSARARGELITILPETRYGYLTLLRVAFRQYPQRAVLGATLMITYSFMLTTRSSRVRWCLTEFYHGSIRQQVPVYGLAFAVGNLAACCCSGTCSTPSGGRR